MEDLNIWITYHDESQIKDYSLKNDETYKLFKANDNTVKGHNINDLNKFYSEICTIYWVYKNQIKSKYIGFSHYRRMITLWSDLESGECITFPPNYMPRSIYQHYKESHNVNDMNVIIDILNEKYGTYNQYSKYLLESNIFIGNCCFIMCYEDFEELCAFLFPILEMYDRKNNLNMNYENYMKKAEYDFRYENVNYQCRAVAFLSERLISSFIYNNMEAISIIRTKNIL